MPPDVLHTFHNPGPGEARFLNLHAPGLGFERYLRGDFTEPSTSTTCRQAAGSRPTA